VPGSSLTFTTAKPVRAKPVETNSEPPRTTHGFTVGKPQKPVEPAPKAFEIPTESDWGV